MATATEEKEKVTVSEKTKADIAARYVYLQGNQKAIIPMEERLPDGTKNVSTCDYTAQGKMINVQEVRPIRLGETGFEQYDPMNPDDQEFLNRVENFLESGDPRVSEYALKLIEGDSEERQPIEMYDKLKPESLIKRMTENVDVLGEDSEAVQEFLERCASYEMNRTYPDGHDNAGKKIPSRKKILDAIDELGDLSGIEYGDDEVTVE